MQSNPSEMTLRRHQRTRTFKPASIVFNKGNTVLDCTLCNFSESGAQLRLRNPVHTSKHFELQLTNERRKINCDVVWRDGDLVGVAFSSRWTAIKPRNETSKLSEKVIEKLRAELSIDSDAEKKSNPLQ